MRRARNSCPAFHHAFSQTAGVVAGCACDLFSTLERKVAPGVKCGAAVLLLLYSNTQRSHHLAACHARTSISIRSNVFAGRQQLSVHLFPCCRVAACALLCTRFAVCTRRQTWRPSNRALWILPPPPPPPDRQTVGVGEKEETNERTENGACALLLLLLSRGIGANKIKSKKNAWAGSVELRASHLMTTSKLEREKGEREKLTSDHQTEADQNEDGGFVVQPVDVVVDDAALRLDELLQRSKQLEHLASGTGGLCTRCRKWWLVLVLVVVVVMVVQSHQMQSSCAIQ